MNLRILVCLSLALFLTLVLKSSTDFPWVDLSSTTCGYISKCYLFHLQIAFPFILSVHGVQTHYQGKWKWCLQSAVFYTTSSYLLKCWILGMLQIYINKKGKEVYICIYMHTYISVYIYIFFFSKLLQSCPTLCDPMDCSLPGFSVHEILQARTLEWVAISFSNAWKWKVIPVADSFWYLAKLIQLCKV